jgi:serine/threonine protein phosphatase PrpC
LPKFWHLSGIASRKVSKVLAQAANEQNLKKLHTLIAELSRAFEEITRKSADLPGS